MNQRDNFASGFLLGSVVGGIVGGVLGTLLASKLSDEVSPSDDPKPLEAKAPKTKDRQLKATDEDRIEVARRSLEDKIAQLNETIDDVRQQLGNVNGNPQVNEERSRIVP